MDQNDRHSSPKSEPSLEPDDAFSVAPPAASPLTDDAAPPPASMDAGDMPAWLRDPVDPQDAGSRWRKPVMWLGGLVAVVALGAVGSQWLLEEHKADSVVEINELKTQAELAAQSQAQAPARPVPQTPTLPPRASDPLPPLVLLPPEQGGKPKVDTPTADGGAEAAEAAGVGTAPEGVTDTASEPVTPPAPVLTPPPAVAAVPTPARPAASPPPAARPVTPPAASPSTPAAAKPLMPPPVTVKSADKPAATKPAAPAKPAVKPKPKPKAVAAKKKPATPPKRTAANGSRRLEGTMLPPPRERESARERDPEPSPARRCIPGELARECEARLKGR